MCACQEMQKVDNLLSKTVAKKPKGIGKTVLANEARANIDFKFPTETVIGAGLGVVVNVLLKVAAENDFGNSPLGEKTTLAMVQGAGGAAIMLLSKSEVATSAGLTILTGAIEPALQSIGIGDRKQSGSGYDLPVINGTPQRKRNNFKKLFFKSLGSRKAA